MTFVWRRLFHRPDTYRPLNQTLKAWCMGVLWLGALPALVHTPLLVVLLLLAIPGTLSLMAIYQPIRTSLRLILLLLAAGGVVMIQSGSGDFRGTGLALMLVAIMMKGTELKTVRDGLHACSFALFAPFAAFLMDMGATLTSVVAAITLFLALGVNSMLTEWEDQGFTRGMVGQIKGIFKLGLVAFPVALLAFWAVPRLQAPLWGYSGGNQSSTGVGNTMSPGDIGNLMQDPSTAFRVTFQGATPALRTLYWRGLTLDTFDGRTWSEAPSSSSQASDKALEKPRLQFSPQAPAVAYSISMEPTEETHLFTLDFLSGPAPKSTHLVSDGRLVSETPLRSFQHFDLVAQPTASLDKAGLTTAERERFLQLPNGFNPQTRARVNEWKAKGLTQEQIIKAALDWFHKDFTYSLQPPPLARNSVDDFLFNTRMGFCEHYSSAFAVLMRMADIPTRVVIGYQGGLLNGYGGYLQVRQAEAHAWDEVWLPGRGWVRVDPTASLYNIRPTSQGASERGLSALTGSGAFMDWMHQRWSRFFEGFNAEQQRDMFRWSGFGALPTWAVATIILAIGLLMGGLALWLLSRNRKPQEAPALRAWRAMVKRLDKAGHSSAASEPPLVMARRLAAGLPKNEGNRLLVLADRFHRWVYLEQADDTLAADIRKLRFSGKRR